jgi:hypothetical protein
MSWFDFIMIVSLVMLCVAMACGPGATFFL